MSAPLSGKVALITGGSKGIGAATALELASQGAKVVINYSSDQAPADELVEKIGKDNALAIKADAGNINAIEGLVKQTIERFGKIDILIPNAGILPMKDVESTTEEDFDRTMNVNVKGPYFLVQVPLIPYNFPPTSLTLPKESIPSHVPRLPHNPPLNLPLRHLNHNPKLPPLCHQQRRHRADDPRHGQGSRSQGHHCQCDCAGAYGHGFVFEGEAGGAY